MRIGDVYAERSERGAEDMELLSVTMNDGVKMRSDIEGKDNSSEDKSNYKIVRAGDMVYNSMRMWQGANGISPWDGIVSPAYTVLKPRMPISNGFFAALFKTHRLINEFRKNSQGMTSDTWNLKYPQIETIKTCIPALAEQEKIADFLMALDHRIEKQRTLVEHLKKYKRGVIERMITELTMDCDLRKISSFAKCVAGATPDTKNHEYWDNGTIPWLSSGEVNKKRITSTDKFITPLGYQKTSTKMLPIKTVIVALAGQGKTRGTVAITEKEVCTNQSLAGIITDNTVDSEYLFYYLETQYDNLRILSSGDGTRGGLNLQLINDYLVPTPSLDKQKFIATFGTLIDKNISGNENLLNQLQLMRSAMLQQLFV